MIYKHVFITWLLTNLLHPVLLVCMGLLVSDSIFMDFPILVTVTIFSAVVSLPALLVACLLLVWIMRARITPVRRYLVWIGTVTALIIACVSFIIGGYWNARADDFFRMGAPSVIAFLVVSGLRYPSFLVLCDAHAKNQVFRPDYTEFEKLKASNHEYKP